MIGIRKEEINDGFHEEDLGGLEWIEKKGIKYDWKDS